MPFMKFLGATGLMCVLLAACSSTGRSYTQASMQETLEIEILPNDSKMFVYRLLWPEELRTNLITIERGANSRPVVERGGIEVNRVTQQRLSENAAYVVKHMGYCQDGFLTIDSSSSRYHLWLKGECKDGATAADKQQFGVKQSLPVRLNR